MTVSCAQGLAYVFLDNRDGQPNELASLTWNLQLGQFGYLSLDVSRSLHQAGGTVVGANWTLPLGQRTASSVEVTSQRGRNEALAEVQQGLPSGPGFGYLIQEGNQGTRNITLTAQTDSGTYNVTEAASQGANGIRLGASGGIAVLDGAHLSRRITDSFGLVEIPDFPNVRIYADNQLMGQTDGKGEVLLPRLRAYEKNVIAVEQTDLPLDAKISSLSLDAVPYFRSGTLLKFPIAHAHDALLSITLDDGSPLPAGALGRARRGCLSHRSCGAEPTAGDVARTELRADRAICRERRSIAESRHICLHGSTTMMGLRRSSRGRAGAWRRGALLIAAAGLSQQSLAANLTCSVTPATLSSGSYNTTNDLSMPMTMTVGCGGFGQTNSVSYVLSASAGSGSYSGRQLLSGGNVITYNLYTTSGETTIWGDGTSGTITLTGTVTKQAPSVNVTIYGLIRGGQNVVPGSYATTTNINVTLTYTF